MRKPLSQIPIDAESPLPFLLVVAAAMAVLGFVVFRIVSGAITEPEQAGVLYAPYARDIEVTCADGVATEISAAKHYGLICQNTSATDEVYFGDSGVSTSSPEACAKGSCNLDWFKALNGQYCMGSGAAPVIRCNGAFPGP